MRNGVNPGGCCAGLLLFGLLVGFFLKLGFPDMAAFILAGLVFAAPVIWAVFGSDIKRKLKSLEMESPPAPRRTEGRGRENENRATREERPQGVDNAPKAGTGESGPPTPVPRNHYDELEEEKRRSHRKKYGE